MHISGGRVPCTGNVMCKGPEVRTHLECSRSSKRPAWPSRLGCIQGHVRERVVGEDGRSSEGSIHVGPCRPCQNLDSSSE